MEIRGTLRKNSAGRWEIIDDLDEDRACELPSGSVCEVQVTGHWIATRIEFDHTPWPGTKGDYYATVRGIQLCVGLPARTAVDRNGD